MTEVLPVSRRLRLMIYTVFFFVIVLMSLLGYSIVTGSARSHQDIIERIEQSERQLTVLSCLVLTPPAERTPEVVAACQVSPEP